jgi:PLP dependent protein
VAELIRDIDPALVRQNLSEVLAAAGHDRLQILVAAKYVADDELPALAEAGVKLVGENRLQDLERKQGAHGDLFTWDFIGALQSRKVRDILPRVRLLHSVCTDSALGQLERHGTPDTTILVQVNVAAEDGKQGVAPAELGDFLERCPVTVAGLMTMPPFTEDPEDSRPHFAALAELAGRHGLAELSMGTSQDWRVAVQEGATIVRLGSGLLRGDMQA